MEPECGLFLAVEDGASTGQLLDPQLPFRQDQREGDMVLAEPLDEGLGGGGEAVLLAHYLEGGRLQDTVDHVALVLRSGQHRGAEQQHERPSIQHACSTCEIGRAHV